MGKIFGTDGIRCIVNQEPMTAEICLQIAKTTAYLLSNNKNPLHGVTSEILYCICHLFSNVTAVRLHVCGRGGVDYDPLLAAIAINDGSHNGGSHKHL